MPASEPGFTLFATDGPDVPIKKILPAASVRPLDGLRQARLPAAGLPRATPAGGLSGTPSGGAGTAGAAAGGQGAAVDSGGMGGLGRLGPG